MHIICFDVARELGSPGKIGVSETRNGRTIKQFKKYFDKKEMGRKIGNFYYFIIDFLWPVLL